MAKSYKTCSNGHNYDFDDKECPYCPKPNLKTQMNTSTSDRTIIEQSSISNQFNQDKSKNPQNLNNADRTIIVNTPENAIQNQQKQEYRKLIGWLVTFDLNAEGIDFRLREGKTTIGRSNKNDVIISANEVSEEHCIILYRNGKLLLNDNLSTNGTFLNGAMIEDKNYLSNDDIITVGKVSLKLKLI